MEWLSKAGELLDKVDQLAAEQLADEHDTAVDEQDVLALLEDTERDDDEIFKLGTTVAGTAKTHSELAEPQSKMARLEGLLDKKTAQVEKLVASHRALLKSRAAREDELNEQVTNMRQELDQAAVQRKLIEQGRKHLEQQTEILKQSIKSKSEELNTLLRQMDAVTHERNSAHDRITVIEQMQQQHEELMSNLQTKYNQAMEQVSATRMAHRSELHDLQDREESLSSASVQFTAELARAERRRQESENAARNAEELQRAAEEQMRQLERRAEELQRLSADKDLTVSRLEQALNAHLTGEQTERDKLQSEARESRKRVEQTEMQLRHMQKQLAEATRAGAHQGNTAELEEQLSKICNDLLAKQALLEQFMSEKTALRSRLDSEAIRTHELQNEIARLHAAKALMNVDRGHGRDLEFCRGGLSEPVADAIQSALKARDFGAIMRAADAVIQHTASAVAQDTAVRAVAACYLLILQVSAMIVLMHALLGSHHHQ